MWDFFETVRHRHSVRKYHADLPIEPEKLHAILEMACAAPSAGDLQAYHIVVVSNEEERTALGKAANNQPFIREAPVSLVFCTDAARSEARFGERGKTLYALQDTTIAASYAQLAAVAAGLASAWVGEFDEKEISRLLSLREGIKPVAILCIGYPAELPEDSPRRPLKDVVTLREA